MTEYILQMCNVQVSVSSNKYCRNYGGLNLDEFELFWDINTTFCPQHFDMKPLSWGSETSHSEGIYCKCAKLRFQFDRPKNVEITVVLVKFEIFWDIYTARKDYANIVTLSELRCVDEHVRASV